MKRRSKLILSYLTLLLYTVGMVCVLIITKKENDALCCNKIEIHFNGEHHFISEEEILSIVKRSSDKNYIATALNEIDLRHIESVLRNQTVIEKGEAWYTRDGVLHIAIFQRDPAIKVISSSSKDGYYVDREGVIFPLCESYEAKVPEIKCDKIKSLDIQLLCQMVDFIDKLGKNDKWKDEILYYSIKENNDFVLHTDKEQIIFGEFKDINQKKAYIEKYFSKIRPLEKNYKIVNVKYKGQIICRQKSM